MRKDEEDKLEKMNAFCACHFLMEREGDIDDILDHLDDGCDTGDSNVIIGRLRGYAELMKAETLLLLKVITTRNLELAKSNQSKVGK